MTCTWRQTTRQQQNFFKASLIRNRHRTADLARDRDGSIDRVQYLDSYLGIPVKTPGSQAVCDQRLRRSYGQALQGNAADERKFRGSLCTQAHSRLVVRLQKDCDMDQVSRREREIVAWIKHRPGHRR